MHNNCDSEDSPYSIQEIFSHSVVDMRLTKLIESFHDILNFLLSIDNINEQNKGSTNCF